MRTLAMCDTSSLHTGDHCVWKESAYNFWSSKCHELDQGAAPNCIYTKSDSVHHEKRLVFKAEACGWPSVARNSSTTIGSRPTTALAINEKARQKADFAVEERARRERAEEAALIKKAESDLNNNAYDTDLGEHYAAMKVDSSSSNSTHSKSSGSHHSVSGGIRGFIRFIVWIYILSMVSMVMFGCYATFHVVRYGSCPRIFKHISLVCQCVDGCSLCDSRFNRLGVKDGRGPVPVRAKRTPPSNTASYTPKPGGGSESDGDDFGNVAVV